MNLSRHFDWLRIWAGIGVFHYALAVAGWALSAFLLLRLGDNRQAWAYLAIRMAACLLMLSGFTTAVVLARRRRRFTKWLVGTLTILTVAWFAFDAYGHDYQIQAMTDHGCDHYYLTWWWYNDRWDPRR
jgi:hypothetical protein